MQWRKPYKANGILLSWKSGSLESNPGREILRRIGPAHEDPPLTKQLKKGGSLIVPLGSTVYFQTLTLATKRKGELEIEHLILVAFVPMVGEMRK